MLLEQKVQATAKRASGVDSGAFKSVFIVLAGSDSTIERNKLNRNFTFQVMTKVSLSDVNDYDGNDGERGLSLGSTLSILSREEGGS